MLQVEKILEEGSVEKLKEHLNNYITVIDFNVKRGIIDELLKGEYLLVLNYFKGLGGNTNEYRK